MNWWTEHVRIVGPRGDFDCWRCELTGRDPQEATLIDPFVSDGIGLCVDCADARDAHPNWRSANWIDVEMER